jgi:hypothetical protein
MSEESVLDLANRIYRDCLLSGAPADCSLELCRLAREVIRSEAALAKARAVTIAECAAIPKRVASEARRMIDHLKAEGVPSGSAEQMILTCEDIEKAIRALSPAAQGGEG